MIKVKLGEFAREYNNIERPMVGLEHLISSWLNSKKCNTTLRKVVVQ